MELNVKDFLGQHNIFYRDRGVGVKKGNVIIHCPFCGEADKSQHLGICLSNGVWGCWKDDTHRGRDFANLVSKLANIPYKQAQRLVGAESQAVDVCLFDEVASEDYFETESPCRKSKIRTILLPEDFRMLPGKSSLPFISYMENRGFRDIPFLFKSYKLLYAITGKYKWRVIFPIYFNKQLVTWTSRAISAHALLRYKTLSDGESSVNIKNTIYNYDNAVRGGKVLFITEGPIDTIKVDYYLEGFDAHAVGLFNMSISDDQLYWLIQLFDKYHTVVLLLDSGEISSANKGIAKLSSTGVQVNEGILPPGVSDPGELKPYQVVNLFKKWCR